MHQDNRAAAIAASLFFTVGSSDKEYHVAVVARDGGWSVDFRYGRRGSTLTTGTKTAKPVTLEQANGIAAKLIAGKKAKGYTEAPTGAIYSDSGNAGRVCGILPQLLNPVEEDQLEAFLGNADYVAQEKMDGKRCILVVENGVVQAVNRKGLFVGFPKAWEDLGKIRRNCILDGEAVGDTFWGFDALSIDGTDLRGLPFAERLAKLYTIIDPQPFSPKFLLAVDTKLGPDKRKLLEHVRAAGGEGIVLKAKDAPYTAGRPASGGSQLKHKLTESATFIATGVHPTKRSVGLALLDDAASVVPMGNVTIPLNAEIPAAGALVEVRYLYAFQGGSVFQPVYLGERDDLGREDAKLSQVRRWKTNAAAAEEDDAAA